MREEITVDKAIKRGQLLVNLPVMFVMFGTLTLCFYLGIKNIMPEWIIPVGFIFAFIFAWLCWSILITKWRLWAFQNVRNVHELKKRAIDEKLIWNDGNIFEKTEIRSNSDKLRWKELQKKFDNKDYFQEDFSIPMETTIYYSKATNYFQLIIGISIIGLGIYLIKEANYTNYILGSIFFLYGLYSTIKEFRHATNTEPQIILNKSGIKTVNTEFLDWSKIYNESVIMEGLNENSEFFLIYDYKNGNEKIKINDFNITPKKLENLLRTYRIRYNKTTANNS